MAISLLQTLIAHFDSVFEGPNGDYPAVLETLKGITMEQATWKPGPECNSIWQIVDHLTDSKMWQIDMLEKSQAAPPVWTHSAGGEATWQAAMERLKEAHMRLKAVLGKIPEESLLMMPIPEWKQTQLELLLSIAAHEANHAGQIDYLKGLRKER
jgi:hypothetical protein